MSAPQPFNLSQFVLKQLMEEDKNECEVVDMLVESGIDREAATKYVDEMAKFVEQYNYKNAWKGIVIGSIMTIGGLISTLALYASGWIVSATIGITGAGIVILVKGINNRYNIY